MDWDPDFAARSPMLEPLREHAAALSAHRGWPRRNHLQMLFDAHGVSNVAGVPLRLVEPTGDAYEERIRLRGEMPFREGGWHDLFNALAWLAYPAAKAALNDAHGKWGEARFTGSPSFGGAKIEPAPVSSGRGSRRDALTVFDESSAIVLSSDETLLDDLRAFRWKRLFVERREEVRAAMRFHVFGHALFEKALRPYIGVTAHALLFTVEPEVIEKPLSERIGAVDALAAGAVGALTTPRALAPLPVLGVPGWWVDNENAAFYDNATYFRSGRRS